uniref:Uncharacterized protein n=1 Tax=Candidatus Kentrum sp. DK TaxID=2126562 RepID=A0A450T3N3_9GAMM|nr:MAG: hypothetical protein BECKDK2373B_GA0170837_109613 [Candidatus Kentron sp. DK]
MTRLTPTLIANQPRLQFHLPRQPVLGSVGADDVDLYAMAVGLGLLVRTMVVDAFQTRRCKDLRVLAFTGPLDGYDPDMRVSGASGAHPGVDRVVGIAIARINGDGLGPKGIAVFILEGTEHQPVQRLPHRVIFIDAAPCAFMHTK